MKHTYYLEGYSYDMRPRIVARLKIVMDDDTFNGYVKWYQELEGCVPDFFDSPLWEWYMDDFNAKANFEECSIDYPARFLNDLAEASK